MTIVKQKIRQALGNKELQQAVLNACSLSSDKRQIQVDLLPNYHQLQDKIKEIRLQSLDNNSSLLEQFSEKFESSGGKVHFVEDSQEACEKIASILDNKNAKQGVKSKSMVSEEIDLRSELKKKGIDCIESDLGEFIVQLANEPPSHITAPALHRSRQSIGRLFADKLNIPYTENPSELTMIARKILRKRFIEADFGISGANFLIADTGQMAIVENEGNVMMGWNCPPLYIAVTGIEKILHSLNDLHLINGLLSKSATGQPITGYLHLFRPGTSNGNDSREVHLVVLDNGRTKAMKDPFFREMMTCLRCGACLNICPVYRSIGGHAYNSIYPGPMGSVLSNLLGSNPCNYEELPQLSTLCGKCKEVCPAGIDIPKMLVRLRMTHQKPLYQSFLASGWKWLMDSKLRLQIFGRAGRGVGSMIDVMHPRRNLDKSKGAFRDRFQG